MGNILIIDDDSGIRTILSKTLLDHGYHVVEASDGDTGIGLLGQRMNLNLVITDICMPGKTGNDVARHIKKNSVISTTPILAITGFVAEAENELFDFILEKPFKILELLEIVDRFQ